jgi:transposase
VALPANKDAAAGLGVDQAAANKWRRRFAKFWIGGLRNEPRSGTPHTIDDAQIEVIIARTLESLPDGATHWSSRGMARATGLSVSTV